MPKTLIPIYGNNHEETVWITSGQWNAVQRLLQNTDHSLSTIVDGGKVTFDYKTSNGSGQMTFYCQNMQKHKNK